MRQTAQEGNDVGNERLQDQLAAAAERAVSTIGDELQAAIAGVRAEAPEYLARAEEAAGKAASFIEQGLTGSIDVEAAHEAASREADALELHVAEAKERAAQELVRRTQRIIRIAATVGLDLARAAIAASVARGA